MKKIIESIIFSIPFLALMGLMGMFSIGLFLSGSWYFLPCLLIFVWFIIYTTKKMKRK